MGQRENVSMGFGLQKAICDLCGIELGDKDIDFFSSYLGNVDKHRCEYLAKKIIKLLPKNITPTKYVSSTELNDDERLVNFYLSNDSSMAIRIAKNGFVPPRVLGQAGIKECNYYYSDIFGEEINSADKLKQKYSQSSIVAKMIPMWIDKLLSCDYNFFVVEDDKVLLIKKNTKKLKLDSEKITYSESLTYPKIRYNSKTIAEIAYVRTTPIIRLQVKNLKDFIKDNAIVKRKQRWDYGLATEKAICEVFNLENNIKNVDENLVNRIIPYVKKSFFNHKITATEYVGALIGESKIRNKIEDKGGNKGLEKLIDGFGRYLHAPMDFYYNDMTISVKTTKESGGLICPDTIGQPSGEERCLVVLKHFFNSIMEISPEKFVDLIYDRKKLIVLIKRYIEYLFSCDYLFYLIGNDGNPECNFYNRAIEGKWASDIKWDESLFTYAKTAEQLKDELRRNNNQGHALVQIDYDGYRIGQFDIHKRKKYIYQFRFNFNKFMAFVLDHHFKNEKD